MSRVGKLYVCINDKDHTSKGSIVEVVEDIGDESPLVKSVTGRCMYYDIRNGKRGAWVKDIDNNFIAIDMELV